MPRTPLFFPDNHENYHENDMRKEYGAFTYALRDKEMVANYIKNQRVHHQRETFEDEYHKHLLNAGIEWNEYRLT